MSLQPVDHLEVRDRREAVALDVTWEGAPLGVLLCLDETGEKVTAITDDIALHRTLVGSGREDRVIELPEDSYPDRKPGWPGGAAGWL